MKGSERTIEIALFLVLLFSFAFFYQGGGANQNSRFDQMRSIVELHQLNLKPFAASHDIVQVDPPPGSGARAKTYPNKAPGMSLVGAAPYFLISRLKPVLVSAFSEDFYHLFTCWLTTVIVVGIPCAYGGVVFFRLLGLFHSAVYPRLLCTLGLFLGTPAFAYSTVLYGHMVGSVLTVVSFYLLLKYGVLFPRKRRASLFVFLSGLAGGWAVVTEYPTIIIVVFLSLYCFFRMPRKLRFAWFLLGALFPAGILLGYNYLVFAKPFYVAYFDKRAAAHAGYRRSFLLGIIPWGRQILKPLFQTSFGPFRGFFHLSPFLVFIFPGIYYFAKARGWKGLLAVLWAMCLLYFYTNTSYVYWYGGKALGPRHAMEILPYLCLLAFFFIVRFPRLSTVLVALSIFLILTGVAVRPEEYAAHPYRDLYLGAFMNGTLSTNRETTFQKNTVVSDYYNSFNLGEVAGLEGQASLFPLYLVWLIGGLLMTAVSPQGNGAPERKSRGPAASNAVFYLVLGVLAVSAFSLVVQFQIKSALQDLAGAGAFKVAPREAPVGDIQLRTSPGHRLQVWEVLKESAPGDTLVLKIQHAAAGREGGFYMVAFGDANGDGKPDAEIARSDFLIAQKAGDWSFWTFPAPEGKVFVGDTWDEGARIYFDRTGWKTKDFSSNMFFSQGGAPGGSTGPRSTNMAIEVEKK